MKKGRKTITSKMSRPLGLLKMQFPTFVSVCSCRDVEKKTHKHSVVGKIGKTAKRGGMVDSRQLSWPGELGC